MKRRRYLLLCAVIGILPTLLFLWGSKKARADLFNELALNPSGEAYEINPDAGGNLWVSDFGSNEIWQVNPATGVYTVYQNLNAPSDARPDGVGNLWWVDFNNNHLGRISLDAGLVTTWTLPVTPTGSSGFPLGTAIDGSGNVWVTDSSLPQVHRFNPGTNELCTYIVPQTGSGDYIVAKGGTIWLGDWRNSHIVRLEPTTNQFTTWGLPPSAIPEGLVVEDSGEVWLADSQNGVLVQLEPAIDQLTTFTLPVGSWPEMVAVQDGRVWYTEDFSGTVGVLDPATAKGITTTLPISSETKIPSCNPLGAGTSVPIVVTSTLSAWASVVLTNVVDSDGWTVYEMPADSSPWGIAVSGEDVFVVDQGRQKLVKVHLPLSRNFVKTLQGNGDEDSSGDVSVGDTLTYRFVVTNTGMANLTNVSISDPLSGLSALNCSPAQPAFLMPGETLDCTATYVVTAGDVTAGSIENTATASSDQTPDDTDSESVSVPTPSFNLVKTLQGNADEDSSGDVSVGDTLTYRFVVTNTGTANLTNVSINDPLSGLSALNCSPAQPAFLVPGETLDCMATYVVTAGDVTVGSIENTATASSDQTPDDTDSESVLVPTPSFKLYLPVVMRE